MKDSKNKVLVHKKKTIIKYIPWPKILKMDSEGFNIALLQKVKVTSEE